MVRRIFFLAPYPFSFFVPVYSFIHNFFKSSTLKKTRLLLFVFSLAFCLRANGQEFLANPPEIKLKSKSLLEKPKGSFTFFWGYNREFFSRSNIHFSSPDYNFTLYNLRAKDRQSPFSFDVYLNPKWFSVPQYNYRFGYYLTDRVCLSMGLDHMKYVMVDNQTATISGNISSAASEKYKGVYERDSIFVSPEFLQFEHTNGFNLLSVEADFVQPAFHFFKNKFSIAFYSGVGAGTIIPKTEVYVLGYGLDNRFHLAGYSFIAKAGPRLNFGKNLFIAADLKGGYANLPSVIVHNDAPYKASHSLWFLEYYVVGGVRFRIGKK